MRERVRIDLRLEGMDIHMAQALHEHIDVIKEDTTNALKKAIESFSYEAFVEHSIHQWMEEQIKDAISAAIDNPLFDIEKDLQAIVIRKIQEKFKELGNKK